MLPASHTDSLATPPHSSISYLLQAHWAYVHETDNIGKHRDFVISSNFIGQGIHLPRHFSFLLSIFAHKRQASTATLLQSILESLLSTLQLDLASLDLLVVSRKLDTEQGHNKHN